MQLIRITDAPTYATLPKTIRDYYAYGVATYRDIGKRVVAQELRPRAKVKAKQSQR